MNTGGRLKLIKGVLYRLKRSFGCPVSVYRQTPQDYDITTGKATSTREVIDLSKVIVLPSRIHRSVIYDNGFAKGNSNFTYGGIFTDSQRQIIIERKDLPSDWILSASDQWYVIYQGKRWEIKTVEEYEFNLAYYIVLDRVDGAILNQISNQRVRDVLVFFDSNTIVTPTYQSLAPVDILAFTQTATVLTSRLHNQQIYQQFAMTDGGST